MAKAKRGLIFSLFSLLFAVAISVTSTYAWFIVNKEVTASNMQVTVKSDNTYLVISGTNTLGSDVTYAATASNAQVLPVMYDEAAASGIKWKTNVGTSYTDGTAHNATYTAISQTDYDNGKYFCKYTFYVGLAASSTAAASHLRVKSMTAAAVSGQDATFLPAVSAVVACNDTTFVDYPNITSITTGDASGQYGNSTSFADLSASVALSTVYTIDVYVYINGDATVVTSANAANLGAFTLSVTFQVS